jgi:UDP:flavonoid glycosyltransferase YjiC (YdhE family)
MKRFLFATLGSLGDLHPYIAVARALVRRGHTAVIATSEDNRTAVEAAGIGFIAIPPRLEELGDRRELLTRLFEVRHGPRYLIRELVMPYLKPVYECLLPAAKHADLLISHPLTVVLPLVAERCRLPWVSTVLSPMSFMSCHDPPLIPAATWLRRLRALGVTPYRLVFNLMKLGVKNWEAPLREFRGSLGLPAMNRMAMFEGQYSPLLNLALFDPQLAAPQPDWPVNTRVCGSPVYDGGALDAGDLDDLENFLAAGEAPIVFALGSSAVWAAGDFWDKAVSAAHCLGRRAVLITGPVTPERLPDSIKAYPYLPYSRVFPRASVIVHQAGIGTLAQAMRAGRPQLIVPVAFDQPDNARRTVALGLGRTLPFRKVTVNRLVTQLEPLLAHAGYATSARRFADQLLTMDGAARAAVELEKVLEK